MSEAEFSLLPLQVLRVDVGGKRAFEPEGKRRLIEACRRPGVSLSGMALKAGINANQLRKWIRRSERREKEQRSLPAFMPVIAVDSAPPGAAVTPSMPHDAVSCGPITVPEGRLTASLPNGVTVDLRRATCAAAQDDARNTGSPRMFRFDPALKVYLHRDPVDG